MDALIIEHELKPDFRAVWEEERCLIGMLADKSLERYVGFPPTREFLQDYLHDLNRLFGVREGVRGDFDPNASIERAARLVREQWGTSPSQARLIPAGELLDAMNSSIRALNSQLPETKRQLEYKVPISSFYDPYIHDAVIVPDSRPLAVTRRLQGSDIEFSDDAGLIFSPWSREEFEVALSHSLNHSAFRRHRGEILGKYLEVVKSLDAASADQIRNLGTAFSESAKYRMFSSDRRYCLPLLTSRGYIWGQILDDPQAISGPYHLEVYACVRSLEGTYPLKIIALADAVRYANRRVTMYLDPRHPDFPGKRETLMQASKGTVREIPQSLLADWNRRDLN